jgi:hypothetical protein
MADDIERLTAQFDADISKFEKSMTRMGVAFDRQAKAIESSNNSLSKKLAGSWSTLDKLYGALKIGVAYEAAKGLGALVTKSLEAAAAIGTTARNAGIGVELLQKLRYASTQTGGSFELMDEALLTFNKNFGQFVNTGTGKAAESFKLLGLDKAVNSGAVRDTGQALDFVVEKIRGYESAAQRAGFASQVFGREAGAKLAGFIDAGRAGIERLEQQAVSLGIVLSEDTVKHATEAHDKLEALFNVLKAQGVSAIASIAPQIASLTQQIINQIPVLIAWATHWAAVIGLINQTPVQKLQYEFNQASSQLATMQSKRGSHDFAESLANSDTAIASQAVEVGRLRILLDQAKKKEVANYKPPPPVVQPPPLKIGSVPKTGRAAGAGAGADLEALRNRQQEAIDRIKVDAATASAALIAAQDSLNVQLLKGSDGYYAALVKQINDEKLARIAEIDAEETRQIDSLNKLKLAQADYAKAVSIIHETAAKHRAVAETEAAAKIDESGITGFMREAATESRNQIQSIKDHAAAVGLDVGALAKLTFMQGELNKARDAGLHLTEADIAKLNAEGDAIAKTAAAAHAYEQNTQNSIDELDKLRSGLEDVGVAATHGFSSAADAAKQLVIQLLELIFKLEVMAPLVKSLFGEQGTSGGGIFGSLFSSLFSGGGSGAAAAIPSGPPFASGGYVSGRGSGTSDSIRARLSNGEFVVNSGATARNLPLLSAMNRGVSLPNLRSGGVQVISVQPIFQIDARYATESTASMIDARLRATAPAIVSAAVRQARAEFSGNLRGAIVREG